MMLDIKDQKIGIIGATSLVGTSILSILMNEDRQAVAFSRRRMTHSTGKTLWRQLDVDAGTNLNADNNEDGIVNWICAAPIWVLQNHFDLLEAYGVRKIVALSSTSLLVKCDSSDPAEQKIAKLLSQGENALQEWANRKNIEWLILRPTLIYGHGKDKNISMVAGFIRRFKFFPLLGKANGLRQPVHANDVANACLAALDAKSISNRIYNLAGGETLSYREMIKRVFIASRYSPRLLPVPIGIFRVVVACLRILPRYRGLSTALALRMNSDLVFDISDAAIDLGFKPRKFTLENEDLPS